MASVRKREWKHNGEHKTAWVVEYTDQNGIRRRKTPRSGLKKDADRLRQEIERDIEGGVHVAASQSVTVAEAVSHYMRECDRRHKIGDMTMGSVKFYDNITRRMIVPKLGKRRLGDLTSEDFQSLIDDYRGEYSANYVHHVYKTLVPLLTFAVRRKWLKRNILRDEPCRLPAIERRKAIPSKADIAKMIAQTEGVAHGRSILSCVNIRAIVALGVFAGLRPGESFGLQWDNVDFAKRIIRVRHNHTHADGLKEPKTASGVRDIPMSAPIFDALMSVARYRTIHQRMVGPGFQSYESGALFARINLAWEKKQIAADLDALAGHVILSKVHKPFTATGSGQSLWKRFMQGIGFVDGKKRPKFSMHALRHANVSLLIEAGLPAMNLKTIIGHASVRTTYDVYGHLFDEDQRTVATVSAIASGFVDATGMRHEPASL